MHIQPYGLVGNAQFMIGGSGHMAIWRPVVRHWCCLVAPTHASDGKESACNAGGLDSIPGLGRFPGEGNGNPLRYPCLENPMDSGAWWAKVHGVAKSRTRLTLSLSVALVDTCNKEPLSGSCQCT